MADKQPKPEQIVSETYVVRGNPKDRLIQKKQEQEQRSENEA
jgi:hypothetical protein